MMQYRLLRNNKESGPYTQEQLIAMGLKPYDLVWIEGRSAGWRYPSEIEEFKPYAPAVEQTLFDQLYKRPQKKANSSVETTINVATPVQTKKEKPRYRVSADWSKVESKRATTPVSMPEPKQDNFKQTSTTDSPSWEKAYNDWQHKTPETAKSKPAVDFTPSKKVEEPEPLVETKYSQSLDDIKERYVEAVLKPKEKTRSQNKEMMLAIGLIALIIAVGFLLNKKFSDTSATQNKTANVVTSDKPKEEQAVVQEDANKNANILQGEQASSVPDNSTNNAASPEQQKVITAEDNQPSSSTTVRSAAYKKPVTHTTALPSSKKNMDIIPTAKPAANELIKTIAKNNLPVKTNNTIPAKTRPAETTEKTVSSEPATTRSNVPAKSSAKKIEDYVVLYQEDQYKGNGVQNVHLTVSNVADFPIDLVVIDVHYYNTKGRYQKGETLYVKNIGGNQNVDVKVPDSPNSSSIDYKVSMLTAEQKTLYLIND